LKGLMEPFSLMGKLHQEKLSHASVLIIKIKSKREYCPESYRKYLLKLPTNLPILNLESRYRWWKFIFRK
jgi:hypothetical protein